MGLNTKTLLERNHHKFLFGWNLTSRFEINTTAVIAIFCVSGDCEGIGKRWSPDFATIGIKSEWINSFDIRSEM